MKRPLLLAHRGFSGNYPENSPLAFRMAVEKTAADGFESDVHITKDGKLVIFHDASV
ncbi:glycerophosphodiester phosphodiesterase family protein, partial [Dysosmobacter sp.]